MHNKTYDGFRKLKSVVMVPETETYLKLCCQWMDTGGICHCINRSHLCSGIQEQRVPDQFCSPCCICEYSL